MMNCTPGNYEVKVPKRGGGCIAVGYLCRCRQSGGFIVPAYLGNNAVARQMPAVLTSFGYFHGSITFAH